MPDKNHMTFYIAVRRIRRILLALVLLFFVFLALYPFVYMILLSFIEKGHTMRLNPEYIKNAKWGISNFTKIYGSKTFPRYFLNSAITCVISCLGTCTLSSMAAYAFAKKRFVGNNKIYMLFMLTMMIPSQVTLIPLYLQMRDMKLLNTYWALSIPIACSAFGTVLLHSFMKGVPDELLESAEIDGCSELQRFITIVIPLIKPALISLTIFTFISTWGDFLWPMISVTKQPMSTLTVGLTRLKNDNLAVDYGFVMAGATVSFMPPIILYAFLQKQFVEGIALSGTKM